MLSLRDQTSRQRSVALISARTFHILVVDDVILMCDFLYKVISAIKNCKVHKATDGRTAIDILASETIDMLITDIEMKAPNGLELLKRLRCGELNNPHDIPVLMFSGNTYKDMVLESLSYDVNDFLAKPLSADGLKKKVLFHLQNEKQIRDPAYYKNIKYVPEKKEAKTTEISPSAENYKSHVAIIRNVPTPEAKAPMQLHEDNSETEQHQLVMWPENSTTGFHQLDRRMLILAQRINSFYNLSLKQSKPIALAAELKRIGDAIDYLLFVGKKIQSSSYNQGVFWSFFNDRVNKLIELGQDLAKINPRYQTQVQPHLKRLSNWWVQTINRPFVRSVDESDHND